MSPCEKRLLGLLRPITLAENRVDRYLQATDAVNGRLWEIVRQAG